MTALACNLNAIPADRRGDHEARARRIITGILAAEPLDDGYRFRLSPTLWDDLTVWVVLERLCCPFFNFRLDLPHDGALYLSLTGGDGVKAFIASEFGFAG